MSENQIQRLISDFSKELAKAGREFNESLPPELGGPKRGSAGWLANRVRIERSKGREYVRQAAARHRLELGL